MSRQSWESAIGFPPVTGTTAQTAVGPFNAGNNKILLMLVVSNPTAAAATVVVSDQGSLNFKICVPANSTSSPFPGYPGLQYTGRLSVQPSVAELIILVGIG